MNYLDSLRASTATPINERVIYVVIVDGQMVRGYAEYEMAMTDKNKLQAMMPKKKLLDPVPLKFYDDRALGLNIGQRIQTAY